MNRTSIEWVKNLDGSQGYTINPVKGLCPVACPYCYARPMYKRFKWNPAVRFDPRAWLGLARLRKPSHIFVGSTMELFHDSLSGQYLKWIFEVPLEFPQHTFIFLTKQPQNLIKWSPFPENCWVGVTATDAAMFSIGMNYLCKVEAKVKFVSFEPLLNWDFKADWDKDNDCLIRRLKLLNWLIIGQQTPVSVKTQPKIEWIREIVEAADKAGIKVFLKNNLKPLLWHETERVLIPDWARMAGEYDGLGGFLLRQEMPK